MGDQDRRHAEIALQVTQKVHDLGLHGHVQRRCRLIRDQQVWLAQQRHRNHHALAHAAGKLVRIKPDAAAGVGDLDRVQHPDAFGKGLRLGHALVMDQPLHHLVADPHIGVERGHRVLKHHGDLVRADGVQRRGGGTHQFGAVEFHGPPCGAVLGQKAKDGKGELAFARPAFAHDAKGRAPVEGEGHAVDRVDGAVTGGEAYAEIVDFQHGHVSGPSGPARRAIRHRQSRRRTWW